MADIEALRAKLKDANVRHSKGDIKSALPIYRSVLDEYPNQPDAMHMLGVIALQMGNVPLALQLFDETLKVAPQFGIGWVNRAMALRMLDRYDEASQSVDKALKADPQLASAWNMSGILLRDARLYDEAVKRHARAVELDPQNTDFLQNYAAALLSCSKVQEAYRVIRRAEKIDPSRADIYMVLGNIMIAAGYPERAIPYYKKSIALDARNTDALIGEANAAFYLGDFARSFELMETRRLYLHDDRCRALPRWDGKNIDHLLLVAEQGAGDNLQALRYIPLLKDRAKRITLQLPEALQKLAQANFPEITTITPQDELPKVDAFEPLMSLAHHCLPPSGEIHAPRSYLRAEEGWQAPWRERLAKVKSPRIGFAWAGNPRQINDYNRSIPLATLVPLVEAARGHSISVQKGNFSGDVSAFDFDAAPYMGDFAAGAGLFAQLDLLVTADTAPAHLMGAMGKPVWVIVPFDPGWRYMLGREDSVLYPSMRIFRQKAPGDWTSALEAVQAELKKYLAGDLSVLAPRRHKGETPRQSPYAITLED
ncbi:MAG TPA: tetratricopeptide repeat protein [Alphaproteobacteria bacterium]|nr:tetratricopeptide repeat protein [Alphaproteobacteria bacterium]